MIPTISVVTINYNSSQETIRMLNSLLQHYPQDSQSFAIEILVIDNASELPDFQNLQTGIAQLGDARIHLLISRTNLGFSGGNMAAAASARGEYLLFLNNDCWIEEDILTPFLNFMCENEKTTPISMIGGQCLDEKGHTTQAYGILPTLGEKLFGRKVAQWIRRLSGHRHQHIGKAISVDLVSGSCMFVNAETFFRIGGLDTSYFLYSEEEDYGKRSLALQYQIFHLPWVRYYHIGGASTLPLHGPSNSKNIDTPLKREFYISFFAYFRKHSTPATVYLLRLFYFLRLRRKSKTLAAFVLNGAPVKSSLRMKQVRKTDR